MRLFNDPSNPILYILDGYELFKANASCLPGKKYGSTFEGYESIDECAGKARRQGLRLFLTCISDPEPYCFLYKKSKFIVTCSTTSNEECSIYRNKEG